MAIHLKAKTLKSSSYRAIEALLLLIMNIILSRSLGAHDFGIISYTLFLLSVLALVTPLGFTTSALRFVPEYIEKSDFSMLKGFILCSFGLTILASLLCSTLLYSIAEALFHDREFYYSLYWAAVLLPVIAMSQLRRKLSEGASKIATSVLPDLLMPVVVILVVLTSGVSGYAGAYQLILMAALLGVIAGLLVTWNDLSYGWEKVRPACSNRHWLAVSIPMVAAGLGNVFMNRSDVLVLGMYSEMDVVGRYAAAVRIVMMMVFFLNAVYVVVAPHLSRAFFNGQIALFISYIRKATVLSAIGGAIVLIPLLVWPEQVLHIFGKDYIEGREVLVILALAQGVHVLLGLSSISLALIGHQKAFAYMVLGGACINILGDIAVAPVFGAIGVAYVTLASTLLLKMVQSYYLFRLLGSELSLGRNRNA